MMNEINEEIACLCEGMFEGFSWSLIMINGANSAEDQHRFLF